MVCRVPTGGRGRPRVRIDPDFLRWAYSHRLTSAIARFLGVGRKQVREQLLEYGIAAPGQAPQNLAHHEPDSDDVDAPPDFLDPQTNDLNHLPPTLSTRPLPLYLSTMSDEELDAILSELRSHYRRAGVCMLDGMLRRLGHRVQTDRIRQSLLRIDPVHRIFDRIRIRRRGYTVPGPNALWHHDGQHGKVSAPSRP